MGGLIEAVLVAVLVGIFTLLGVWVSGRQEHKRAREAREADREADKEKMLYEKQLETLEEAIKWLTFMHIEWRGLVGVYGRSGISQRMREILEEEKTLEIGAKIRTYLPLETKETFQEYSAQAIAIVEGMRLFRGKEGDVEGMKEQLDVAYEATVLKMREHLDIKVSVGVGKATRIGGRHRLRN